MKGISAPITGRSSGVTDPLEDGGGVLSFDLFFLDLLRLVLVTFDKTTGVGDEVWSELVLVSCAALNWSTPPNMIKPLRSVGMVRFPGDPVLLELGRPPLPLLRPPPGLDEMTVAFGPPLFGFRRLATVFVTTLPTP